MISPKQLSPDRDEEAATWCLTIESRPLEAAEQTAFEDWMGDPANAIAFGEAVELLNLTHAASETPEIISARATALERLRSINKQRWGSRLALPSRRAGALAAGISVAILSAILILHGSSQPYKTEVGERRIAVLTDGSRLSLDGESEVDVQMRPEQRALTLEHGRAKFDVAKDPLRPFVVNVGGKMVVATGTSFSVELLDGDVHVVLYQGHVSVLDKRDNRSVARAGTTSVLRTVAADQALRPGRELIVAADKMASARVVAADLTRSSSWEAGQLSFEEEPLASAIARENRYSRVRLEIGDAVASRVRVSGVFTAGDTAAFVEGLTALAPVSATQNQDVIVFRGR